MKCQLYCLPQAGPELSAAEKAALRLRKTVQYLRQASRKVASNPSLLSEKLKAALGASRPDPKRANGSRRSRPTHALGLQPGERVRVKPSQAILATLNERGRFEGLAYMRSIMDAYCDGVYIVRKRVDRFFDEKNRKLRKLRNVVILDGVFCEPPRVGPEDYAGCARTCFLFWKEAWLEREGDDASTSKH